MSKKILVVDDDPSICMMLRKFLVIKGCQVIEAHNGDQAVLLYRHEKPDAVLLDMRMPGKDGLETLREIKAIDPEASVIMVTAVGNEELALQVTEKGVFEYITKPVDPDYLEMVLLTKLALVER